MIFREFRKKKLVRKKLRSISQDATHVLTILLILEMTKSQCDEVKTCFVQV